MDFGWRSGIEAISIFFSDAVFRIKNGGMNSWSIIIVSDEVKLFMNGRAKHSLDFSNVVEISTYKKDLVTVDSVCLFFRCSNGFTLEFTEEMSGFDDLVKTVSSRFGLGGVWVDDVRSKPFEANVSILWDLKRDKH